MKTVKPLPEGVRDSMRSGVVMFDMTRVVEELVFNSIDAGASKVSIFVGVVTCYVKVVDNGSGISRDDLVLLGERYSTSKLHSFADVEGASESFGFRGEALASISNISLLEIITKAIGRPNGYRKVMKGSKCLYLGIDDDGKDSGTTVLVRDLFYNQPVRRKYMQSSPKKVLDSIKKSVHRISLVHSNILFNILDIESDEQLLQTNSSSSALSLLMRGSGIQHLTSFHKVNASDGLMKISGYISVLGDSSVTKAFQYVYINSRFVSKGPIHKLLNHLAASCECMDPWKSKEGGQTGKRGRPQSSPAYMLCITCPRNLYYFSFEPSKTYVEFKNWEHILAFIRKVILAIWREDMSPDWSEVMEPAKKRLRTDDQTSPNLLPSPFSGVIGDGGRLYLGNHAWSPHFELEKENEKLEVIDSGSEFIRQTDNFLKSWDTEIQQVEDFLPMLDAGDMLGTSFATGRKSSKDSVEAHPIDKSLGIDQSFRQESEKVAYRLKSFNGELDVSNCIRKQFLHGCSSRGTSTLNEPRIYDEGRTESLIPVLDTSRDCLHYDENSDIFEIQGMTMPSDCSPRAPKQDNDLFAPQHFRQSKRVAMREDSDFVFKDAAEFFPYEETFIQKKSVSVAHLGNDSLCCLSSERSQVSFDPPSKIMWDSDDYTRHEVLGESSTLQWRPNYGNLFNEDHNLEFDDNIMPQMSCQEAGAIRLKDSFVDWKDYTFSGENFSTFFREHVDHVVSEPYDLGSSKFVYQDGKQSDVRKQKSTRGHSAPPFYRQKKRFISLSCWSGTGSENSCPYSSLYLSSSKGDDSKCQSHSSGAFHVHNKPSIADNVVYHGSNDAQNRRDPTSHVKASIGCTRTVHSGPQEDDEVKDFISEDSQDPVDSMTKWRDNPPAATVAKQSRELQDQDCVLDISSGFLQHLASEFLVPESMNRSLLGDARVLQQVDKKFIPIVAGGTLAIVDQHAADERIRLEELRQKVLAGEAREVTYLDTEQELILPEIGYQLLESYAEQIRDWGWICSINVEGSKSFKKNMSIIQRHPTPVTLHAVPCILGVNLSDADLLEFLQQLADTDGSSTIPPSVLRVLNSKACRGAIMFGDSLLSSECSLIIEELKQTSLCFQCAHGRPTTVPVVKLNALHKQIVRLGSTQQWHGLQRQEIALDRARTRLNKARS